MQACPCNYRVGVACTCKPGECFCGNLCWCLYPGRNCLIASERKCCKTCFHASRGLWNLRDCIGVWRTVVPSPLWGPPDFIFHTAIPDARMTFFARFSWSLSHGLPADCLSVLSEREMTAGGRSRSASRREPASLPSAFPARQSSNSETE